METISQASLATINVDDGKGKRREDGYERPGSPKKVGLSGMIQVREGGLVGCSGSGGSALGSSRVGVVCMGTIGLVQGREVG